MPGSTASTTRPSTTFPKSCCCHLADAPSSAGRSSRHCLALVGQRPTIKRLRTPSPARRDIGWRRAAHISARRALWIARQVVCEIEPADAARGPDMIARADRLGSVEARERHVQEGGLVAQELGAALPAEEALGLRRGAICSRLAPRSTRRLARHGLAARERGLRAARQLPALPDQQSAHAALRCAAIRRRRSDRAPRSLRRAGAADGFPPSTAGPLASSRYARPASCRSSPRARRPGARRCRRASGRSCG